MVRGLSTLVSAVEKLERALQPAQGYVVWASCPIPEDEHPVTNEIVRGWLRNGLARTAFGLPHVVKYHGGGTGKMTMQEWMAKYG